MTKLEELNNLKESTEAHILKEAKAFFQDETNDFDERIRMFNRHGEYQPYIYDFKDEKLNLIFNYQSNSQECYTKLEDICLDSMIEMWVEFVSEQKVFLTRKNSYTIENEIEDRDIYPDQEVLDRYEKYLMNLAMKEGVSSFGFVW